MKRVIPYKYVTKCERCDTLFGYEDEDVVVLEPFYKNGVMCPHCGTSLVHKGSSINKSPSISNSPPLEWIYTEAPWKIKINDLCLDLRTIRSIKFRELKDQGENPITFGIKVIVTTKDNLVAGVTFSYKEFEYSSIRLIEYIIATIKQKLDEGRGIRETEAGINYD